MRACRKCGRSFEPSAYQAAKYDWICEECRRAHNRVYYRAYRARPDIAPERAADARRYYSEPSNRPKIEAKQAVRTAIKNGTLQKRSCEVCGEERSHAHHNDYSKPLDVRWLCSAHHVALHLKGTFPCAC
jgi:hypothetical protein